MANSEQQQREQAPPLVKAATDVEMQNQSTFSEEVVAAGEQKRAGTVVEGAGGKPDIEMIDTSQNSPLKMISSKQLSMSLSLTTQKSMAQRT